MLSRAELVKMLGMVLEKKTSLSSFLFCLMDVCIEFRLERKELLMRLAKVLVEQRKGD